MRPIMTILFAAIVAAPVALTGCDRTVSETERTHSDSNGNVVQEKKTVTQDTATGDVKVDTEKTEKKVDNR